MAKHGKLIPLITTLAVLCLFTFAVWDLEADKTRTGVGSLNENTLAEKKLAEDCPPYGILDRNETGKRFLSPAASSYGLLQCKFYNEKDFLNSVAAAKKNKYTAGLSGNYTERLIGNDETAGTVKATEEQDSIKVIPEGITGGIVPHHLLAGKMIAEFFQYIAKNPPDNLVIIAPNHKKVGISGINTSKQNWATAFGTLDANQELAESLIKNMKAAENPELLEEEHSIAALVPYIKYYLPDTKIIPILLHGNYKSPEKLGTVLSDMVLGHRGTAIIASVDFSHYLDVETANKKDTETLEAIEAYDTGKISLMNNDNLDSPASLIALIGAMKVINAESPEVISHSNSSNITGTGANYTTGYFTIIYRQP